MNHTMPTDTQERKDIPLARGLLDYFPAALGAVAEVSKAGNDKHNPGEEMHHARGKSMDHPDCILRHLVDRGSIDPEDGLRHTAKVAWRALALLQEELEQAGEAPLPRGAREPVEVPETAGEPITDRIYILPIDTPKSDTKRPFRLLGEPRKPKAGEYFLGDGLGPAHHDAYALLATHDFWVGPRQILEPV